MPPASFDSSLRTAGVLVLMAVWGVAAWAFSPSGAQPRHEVRAAQVSAIESTPEARDFVSPSGLVLGNIPDRRGKSGLQPSIPATPAPAAVARTAGSCANGTGMARTAGACANNS